MELKNGMSIVNTDEYIELRRLRDEIKSKETRIVGLFSGVSMYIKDEDLRKETERNLDYARKSMDSEIKQYKLRLSKMSLFEFIAERKKLRTLRKK